MPKQDLIQKLYNVFQMIAFPNEEAIDNLLDDRDNTSFSSSWMSAYNAIEDLKQETIEDLIAEEYRENIFKAVYKQTASSDLSAYVCDDFTLLIDAINCNYENTWLNALLCEYQDGKIPCGQLQEREGMLSTFLR